MKQLAQERAREASDVFMIDQRTSRTVARLEPLLRWLLVLNVVFLPLLVPRGPQNTVPADLPAVALIALGAVCLWRTRRPLHLPFGGAYALIVAGGMIAAGQSIAPKVALTAVAIDIYLFVWFAITLNCLALAGKRAIEWFVKAWVATAVVGGVLGTLAGSVGPGRTPMLFGYEVVDEFDRFSGTFKDPNMAACYFVVSMFVLWASPWPRSPAMKILWTVPLLLAVQATKSNTALFALVAGVLVMIGVAFIRSRRTPAALAVGVLATAVLVVALIGPQVAEAPADIARSLGEEEIFQGSLSRFDSSLGGRVDRIGAALRVFGPDLVLGIGPSTTNDTLIALDAPVRGELHTDYLAALVERGVLGVLGVLSLFALIIGRSLKLLHDDVLHTRGWSAAAFTGAVVSVAVTALSLETLHFRHVWMLLALICALGFSTHLSDGAEEGVLR